jgi:hypothetical protein
MDRVTVEVRPSQGRPISPIWNVGIAINRDMGRKTAGRKVAGKRGKVQGTKDDGMLEGKVVRIRCIRHRVPMLAKI